LVLADQLIVLEGGRIVQEGTPAQIARQPSTDYVAKLVGPLAGAFTDRGSRSLPPRRRGLGSRPAHSGGPDHLPPDGKAAWPGSEFAVTALDPPYFGPDGIAIPAEGGAARPEQVRQYKWPLTW
jgi:hypothetical protein